MSRTSCESESRQGRDGATSARTSCRNRPQVVEFSSALVLLPHARATFSHVRPTLLVALRRGTKSSAGRRGGGLERANRAHPLFFFSQAALKRRYVVRSCHAVSTLDRSMSWHLWLRTAIAQPLPLPTFEGSRQHQGRYTITSCPLHRGGLPNLGLVSRRGVLYLLQFGGLLLPNPPLIARRAMASLLSFSILASCFPPFSASSFSKRSLRTSTERSDPSPRERVVRNSEEPTRQEAGNARTFAPEELPRRTRTRRTAVGSLVELILVAQSALKRGMRRVCG